MSMNDKKVRARVHRCRPWISEKTWHLLEELGFYQEAEEMSNDGAVTYLVRWIDKLADATPRGGIRHPYEKDAENETLGKVVEGHPYLGDYENARAQAIAEYSALLADRHPEVVRFRRGYLNAKTLA